tara:strand:- start:2334 stop:2648 length:315 start_codon:yes stop_codon:yes gene_type:complete
MIISQLNFLGDYKQKTPTGTLVSYALGDSVYFNNETYVASREVIGHSPAIGIKVGWICLSKTQVLYETETEPFYSKPGDEWFNTLTGIKYSRINDTNGDHWVQF